MIDARITDRTEGEFFVHIRKAAALGAVYIFTVLATPLLAEDDEEVPAVFSDVLQCRDIPDDHARLECFDIAVAAMAQAKEGDDLVVVSREQVRETRRGLFGLKLPVLKIFGGKGEDDGIESVKQIEARIASVGQGQNGFVFRLEDGAVWDQTDKAYMRTPKPGDSIVIERAALGSYFAKVNGGVSVRVKRRN